MEEVLKGLKEELKQLNILKQTIKPREDLIKLVESQQERIKEQIKEIETDLFVLCNA